MRLISSMLAALLIGAASTASAQVCGGYYQPYTQQPYTPVAAYPRPVVNAGYTNAVPQGLVVQPGYYRPPAYATGAYYSPVGQPAVGQPAVAPPAYLPTQAYRPVVQVAAPSSSPFLGQGLLGQPKAYVPGQPLRNFLRYLTP